MNYRDDNDDGRYVAVRPPLTVQQVIPPQMGAIVPIYDDDSPIASCAGCSNLGTENPEDGQFAGRPWWFWVGIGVGVGAGIYFVKRSRILRNPDELSEAQIAQQAAAIAVQSGVPTILWGAPGIGKTTWLEALGEAMDAEVFTVIGSTKDPADIGGIMKLDGSLVPPVWAQEIRARADQGKRSVLFLDEFTSMSPLVHAAMLRVVREKIAGELNFDPKSGPLRGEACSVVAAANPSGEGAGAIDLPPPAANRMLHIKWPEPSGIIWGLGLMLGWARPRLFSLPKDWRKTSEAMSAKEDIAAFLRRREELFMMMPKTQTERGLAWPSPRTWDMAAEALGAGRAVWAPMDVQALLVKGCVGEGPGGEFMNWIKERDLPDAEEVMLDPTIWDVKNARSDQIYAVGQSLVAAVQRKPSEERFLQAWDVVGYVVDETNKVDAMFTTVLDLTKIATSDRYPQIKGTKPPSRLVKKFFPMMKKVGVLKGLAKKKK
jgi:MoxR-like ATPase